MKTQLKSPEQIEDNDPSFGIEEDKFKHLLDTTYKHYTDKIQYKSKNFINIREFNLIKSDN